MTYKDEQHSQIIPIRWDKEIIKLREEYKCEHGHNGITHPNCYNVGNGLEERKGALDIEAGALDADFDIILSWGIKTIGGIEEFHSDCLDKTDLDNGTYDSRVLGSLIDAMWKYDRIVTHYGLRFDIPFVRARYLWLLARKMYNGTRFPGYGEMYVTDTYVMAKKLLKISSRRQGSVAKTVLGTDIKTAIDRDYWLDIKYGNNKKRREAIKYIVHHNRMDILQLEGNYLTMLPFCREIKTSI